MEKTRWIREPCSGPAVSRSVDAAAMNVQVYTGSRRAILSRLASSNGDDAMSNGQLYGLRYADLEVRSEGSIQTLGLRRSIRIAA